jgi:dephospho-CoA kinase
MLTIVLTGGLGAGKTTAADYFNERGATCITLDDIARRLLVPGSHELDSVIDAFGEGVLTEGGALDREALARAAFTSPAASARLNAIVHPAVAREVGPALRELDMLPMKPTVVVLEVPLLPEAPVFRELADQVLAIQAPVEVRVARSVARGMSEDDARSRIACQATDEERAELADDLIDNDGDLDSFLVSLERYWDERVIARGPVDR